MKVSVEKPGTPEELAHHGVKGMRWGVHSKVTGSSGFKALSKASKKNVDNFHARQSAKTARRKAKAASGSSSRLGKVAKRVGAAIDDTVFEMNTKSDAVNNHITMKATDRLIKSLPAIRAKHGEYGKLRNRAKRPFSKEAKAYREDVKKTYLRHLEKTANELTNKRGTLQYTVSENGKPNTSQYFWKVSTRPIKHASDGSFTVRPIFDEEGYIVDFEIVDDKLAQTTERGLNFLIHNDIIEV